MLYTKMFLRTSRFRKSFPALHHAQPKDRNLHISKMAANMIVGKSEPSVTSLIIVLELQNWCLDLGFQGQGIQILYSHKPLLNRNCTIQDGHHDCHLDCCCMLQTPVTSPAIWLEMQNWRLHIGLQGQGIHK